MVSTKLIILLSVAAFVALASTAVVSTNEKGKIFDSSEDNDQYLTTSPIPDYTGENSDDDDDDDTNAEIDGISLKYLSEEELQSLLDEEDTILSTDLDIIVIRQVVESRKKGERRPVYSILDGVAQGGRRKRWVGLIIAAGRALFKGAVRAAKPTISGQRITQSYVKSGNYQSAVRDFQKFSPQNLKNFSKNGISGQTGTVGNHRFTVRNGSKEGSPTLEIRTPKSNGEYVRKFRYNQE